MCYMFAKQDPAPRLLAVGRTPDMGPAGAEGDQHHGDCPPPQSETPQNRAGPAGQPCACQLGWGFQAPLGGRTWSPALVTHAHAAIATQRPGPDSAKASANRARLCKAPWTFEPAGLCAGQGAGAVRTLGSPLHCTGLSNPWLNRLPTTPTPCPDRGVEPGTLRWRGSIAA